MAVDKLVDSTQLNSDLTSVANAIRTKGGTSAQLAFPSGFVSAIESIQTGTAPTGTINISTNGTHDVADYAYANVSVPTGTARSSSDLTASNLTVTAPAGLYASNATKTLSDANLVAGNIKKDVTIFGTTGTYEGGGGGGEDRPSADENDVILIDFDGRILYSYSAQEFAALTELPTLPTVKYPFIQQDGWNWTLADAKTYVAKYKGLVIGAQYDTKDSKAHLYAELPSAGVFTLEIRIMNYGNSSGNSITIDWGDESQQTVETGIGRNVTKTYTHTYASKGAYDIAFSSTNPNYSAHSFSYNGYVVAYAHKCENMNAGAFPVGAYDLIICTGCSGSNGNMLKNTFTDAVIFPRSYSTASNNSNWMSAVKSLRYVSWGKGVLYSTPGYVYQNCSTLRKFYIPEESTQIGNSTFSGCSTLLRLDVSSGITSIAANAFASCSSLQELHFYPTSPPSVDNANAFSGLPTSCKIYVPSGKLTDYTTASNYPSSSTYTYVEE